MKAIFNPGTSKKALTLMDNIVYSTVKDFRAAPERKQRDACCCR